MFRFVLVEGGGGGGDVVLDFFRWYNGSVRVINVNGFKIWLGFRIIWGDFEKYIYFFDFDFGLLRLEFFWVGNIYF